MPNWAKSGCPASFTSSRGQVIYPGNYTYVIPAKFVEECILHWACANHSDALDCFGELHVQRTARYRLQSLKLTASLKEVNCKAYQRRREGYAGEYHPRVHHRNQQDACYNHGEETDKQDSFDGQELVHVSNRSGEPVHDATRRIRVEKADRSQQETEQHLGMEPLCRLQGAKEQHEFPREGDHECSHGQSGVYQEVQKFPLVLWREFGQLCQPQVRRNRSCWGV